MITINTTRFGPVEVAPERIITFPGGIIGYDAETRFALFESAEGSLFFWLQAVDTAWLAWAVTDPTHFVLDYAPRITPELLKKVEADSLDEVSILAIVRRDGSTLLGNLAAPLVINRRRMIGIQAALTGQRWSIRTPLLDLVAERLAPAGAN